MNISTLNTFQTSGGPYNSAYAALREIFTSPPTPCSTQINTIIGSSVNGQPVSYRSRPNPEPSYVCRPTFGYLISASYGIFSPGVCPESYTAYPTATIVVRSTTTTWMPTDSVTTQSYLVPLSTPIAVTVCMCCPSASSSCVATRTFNTGIAIEVSPAIATGTAITSTYSGTLVEMAYAYPIAWEAGDLAAMTPASAVLQQIALVAPTSITSLATSSAAMLGTAAPSPSPSSSQTSASQPAAPSPSAQPGHSDTVGLGVGLGVGLTALLALTLLATLYFRRRKARQQTTTYASPEFAKAELPGQEAEKRHAELGTETGVIEVSGADEPTEMGDPKAAVEMDGRWRGYEAGGGR
ncbi:hypothetical protein LTR91_012554 [Friedmanniomyces endolithicus]|uniref:Mid2 domain-containing protein n=1 Tax=Friedmanniomyces endolithicus TaxID=329885 RepID=A0AAN6QQ81_9PEZI|nr:hypothetical protein LTR57_005147 [Friedmanniomyces endolithicus]KAK0979648.1 hypothetical protein LTR91_012554 [Friedmanniomyces endolithicus]KAK0988784.1 hypothetical protein LTS01_009053 [Friedmanniomyces endolithicus]